MTANVLASNRNAEKLLEMVRTFDPDILVTLESNLWWQQRLDMLEEEYPFTIKCPSENLYGMHVYSRFVLQEESDRISGRTAHSLHACPGCVAVGRRGARTHFLHPEPPSPQHKKDSSERDAELVVVAKIVAKTDTPTIVTGDLNDVAWSTTTRLFRKISGLLDPRVGRGMFNTFHADYWFLRWPLDHLFHSSHFTLAEIHRLTGFGCGSFSSPGRAGAGNRHGGPAGGPDGETGRIFRWRRKKHKKKDVSEQGCSRTG
jgi:endonuclease/exonuclease/phosphatase (EEP) superfamily protein YafD